MSRANIKTIQADTVEKEGKLVAIASTEDEDRVGDSLKLKDWDLGNFLKNPVLQAGHDYKPQFTIGIAENIKIAGGQLTFEPKFHEITPLAKQIKQMYEEKFLRAWSVGFIPGDTNELLEVSAVAVPANASALTLYKSLEGQAEEYDDGVVKSIEDWVQKSVEVEETPGTESVQEEELPQSDNKPEAEPVSETVPSEVKTLEAQERWNKTLSKAFDVSETASRAATYELDIFRKFLDCKVKDIFLNYYDIPSPLLGSYLSGFKTVLSKYNLVDTRSFGWDAGEFPPMREVIQLNSVKSEDFLINGTEFYGKEMDDKYIVKFQPTWSGMSVLIATSSKNADGNRGVLKDVHAWVAENNYLKGEKFALSGEFLSVGEETWDDLVLRDSVSDPVKRAVKQLNNKGKDAVTRGLLFMGKPGTGKTKSGRVMMKEALNSTFIWVSSKDMRYGGGISLAFKLAADLAPSILFFEDIDAWLRGQAVDTLKAEMDGIKQNRGIVTVLTSNSPEALPDALIDRPGRFHDVLEFNLPDSGQRKELIQKLCGWNDLAMEVMKESSQDVEKILGDIVEQTEGYSCAHLKELVDYSDMIMEDEGLLRADALLKSLEKLKAQRELVADLRSKQTTVKSLEDLLELKEGRVLSASTRGMITETVTTLKTSIVALEKLLQDTEPQAAKSDDKVLEVETPKELKGDNVKGRDPGVVGKPKVQKTQVSESEVLLRALQKIAGQTNHAIYSIKRKDK